MALKQTTKEDYERRILRAEQLLASRLDEAVSPAELAKASAFSLHHFHRIFRAELGETVMQHVRRLRLERAARRLRSSEERIVNLALEAGYESHEAFTRAFSERFGVTPSDYRAEPSPRVLEHARAERAQPTAQITVERYEPLHVAFARHRGGYAGIDEFWLKVMTWAGERGLLARGAPLYGVCPDDPEVTPEEQLRFDACVIVKQNFELGSAERGAWGIATIPGGTYAVGLHVGPFYRLAETYLDVIGKWFPTSGYEPSPDPVVEHYLDDPRTTPEHALRTEVRVRIAEA